MKHVTIYTDGSCLGNPGAGGWGAILVYNQHQSTLSGSEADTTNNRMELMAAIRAIESLNQPCRIDLYTDSKYLKQGISEWIENWRKNNWRNSRKQPIKNIDLWQRLDYIVKNHKITWHWVKGHAGDKMNELADSLATEAARGLQEG